MVKTGGLRKDPGSGISSRPNPEKRVDAPRRPCPCCVVGSLCGSGSDRERVGRTRITAFWVHG